MKIQTTLGPTLEEEHAALSQTASQTTVQISRESVENSPSLPPARLGGNVDTPSEPDNTLPLFHGLPPVPPGARATLPVCFDENYPQYPQYPQLRPIYTPSLFVSGAVAGSEKYFALKGKARVGGNGGTSVLELVHDSNSQFLRATRPLPSGEVIEVSLPPHWIRMEGEPVKAWVHRLYRAAGFVWPKW